MKFEMPINQVLEAAPDKAYQLLSRGPDSTEEEDSPFGVLWNKAVSVARREGFLHWQVAFPGIWNNWRDQRSEGGFDAVIGNPPWDRIKLQEVEWFATRAPDIARLQTAAQRKKAIKQLREQGDPLAEEFDEAKKRADELSLMIRKSDQYPLLSGGDINLYSLFVERATNLIKPDGLVGLLTPSGIYADLTAARFFRSVSTSGQVAGLYDFENRRLGTGLPPFFVDVDSRFKFCALIFGGQERTFAETRCGFFLDGSGTINDPDRCFPLSPEDFARVNPNTGTAPVFRSRRDADITRSIYERHPALVDRSSGQEVKTWPVKYMNMFHMANDSHLFRTREELEEKEGAYPIGGNRFNSPHGQWVPLYEGKMVQAFDHRAADTTVNEENLFRPGQQETIPTTEKQDFDRLPISRYFVQLNETRWISDHDWIIAFKNVTATTNIRTMIASILPKVGAGHSLNLLTISEDFGNTPQTGCLIVANLNAFVFDFVARQKVPGNNFTLYLLEQLPVIKTSNYERLFGDKSASRLICDHVLRLTYTSHDMAPFARELGYEGLPFTWDKDERRHLHARLDALYFHLYGLTREDASYVLDTFPIVRREDEAEFGRYRTKDLILAYMNALAAGDMETIVAA